MLCQYPYLQIFSGYASYSRLNYKFLEVSKFLWYNHILGIVLPSETFQSNENIYWVPTLIESKVFYKNMLALILMLSLTDSWNRLLSIHIIFSYVYYQKWENEKKFHSLTVILEISRFSPFPLPSDYKQVNLFLSLSLFCNQMKPRETKEYWSYSVPKLFAGTLVWYSIWFPVISRDNFIKSFIMGINFCLAPKSVSYNLAIFVRVFITSVSHRVLSISVSVTLYSAMIW